MKGSETEKGTKKEERKVRKNDNVKLKDRDTDIKTYG
jgi:hypothetical protein